MLETRVCGEGGPAVHRAHVGHVVSPGLRVSDVVPVLLAAGELLVAVPALVLRPPPGPAPLLVLTLSAVRFVDAESLD